VRRRQRGHAPRRTRTRDSTVETSTPTRPHTRHATLHPPGHTRLRGDPQFSRYANRITIKSQCVPRAGSHNGIMAYGVAVPCRVRAACGVRHRFPRGTRRRASGCCTQRTSVVACGGACRRGPHHPRVSRRSTLLRRPGVAHSRLTRRDLDLPRPSGRRPPLDSTHPPAATAWVS
jgi:hypothetical protein